MANRDYAKALRQELGSLKTRTLRQMAQAVEQEAVICTNTWVGHGENEGAGCLFTAACAAKYKSPKKVKEIIQYIEEHSDDAFDAVVELTGEKYDRVFGTVAAFDSWAGRDSKSKLVTYTYISSLGKIGTAYDRVLRPKAQQELLGFINDILAERS